MLGSMKIVVAATRHPHALSRGQVERLFAALPTEFAESIDEFILATFDRWPEPFTWLATQRQNRVEFCMIVKDKTPETTDRALLEFLIGLARIQAGSKFDRPLSKGERAQYTDVVAQWLPVARAAIGAQVV